MASLFKAHIFKERARGEREEVKIKLFNMDGSPADVGGGGGDGGGSSSDYIVFEVSGLIPNGDVTQMVLTVNNILGQTGVFEAVNEMDDEIEIPPGMYLIKFAPSWSYGGALNETDGMSVLVADVEWDQGGGSSGYFQFGNYQQYALHDDSGWGDSQLRDQVPGQKLELGLATEPGVFRVRAQQTATAEDSTVNAFITLVKVG